MRKTILAACAALAVVVAALPAFAGGGPKDHLGLFLRLGVGGGYASSGDEDEGVEIDVSGIGGDFTFLLGGCVSENLALHGALWSWSLWDPDVELEDDLGNELEGELDGSLSMNAYGGGMTYYMMPQNMYFTANVGMARLSIDSDEFDIDESSDWGFALEGSVGKEWWVGTSWGLGLGAMFGFHSIEDVTGWNAGVRFTATFN